MLTELLRELHRYLFAHISLEDFETWILSSLQKVLDSQDALALDLANEIDADLIEFNEGLIDQLVLRRRLEGYSRRGRTVFVQTPDASLLHSGTNSSTIAADVEA
ncbi:MAG: hypothetical protein HYS14_03890 [Candidatus Rokubacteria bacterium]|nr:hypothetical protein [Candidatus Rokubacteria bacterium]